MSVKEFWSRTLVLAMCLAGIGWLSYVMATLCRNLGI
jgi:hypothetical protein